MKHYLPITVYNMPVNQFIDDNGSLKPKVNELCNKGIVKIIAGPTKCHVVIDIKRPYESEDR